MNWREEHYAELLEGRGWTVNTVQPRLTTNTVVFITNKAKNITDSVELAPSELERVNTWAFWKALGIEYRLLRGEVQTTLMNAFEEAARFGKQLHFDIPPEWAEAQQLEDTQLEVFAELQVRGKQEAV